MNTHANRRTKIRVWTQACLVALLIDVLVFPPGLLAQASNPNQVTLNWNGNTGNWTDTTATSTTGTGWGCTINCSTDFSNAYPDNGNPNNSSLSSAYTYLANIATGNDSVTLDSTQPAIAIDGLTLGTVGGAANSSQLTLSGSGQSLTIGSSTSPSTLLTVNGGGTLNLNDGTTLTLVNAIGGTAYIENDGSINVGQTTGASLMLQGSSTASTSFDITSQSSAGNIYLNGTSSGINGYYGNEQLINDTGHTITVSSGSGGTISNLTSVTNNGMIQVGDSNGGASLTIDTSSSGSTAGSFSNTYTSTTKYGQINVLDGSTLTLQNLTNSAATFNNDGVITLGQTGGAALQLNSGGNLTAFTLGSANGTGILSVQGTESTIAGESGYESLINGANHTINVGTSVATGAYVYNLAGFTNNGNIHVGSATANSSLTIDTTPYTTYYNLFNGSFSNTGNITVADGSTLTFQNLAYNGGTAVFNNDGTITVGQSGGAALDLSDYGDGTVFDLTSQKGTGQLILNGGSAESAGYSAIYGYYGDESLINDTGHTIQVNGAGLIYLAEGNFTNNGTLHVNAASELLLYNNFTNVNQNTGVLTGGNYFVGSGALLGYFGPDITGIGTGTTVTLDNAGGMPGSTGLLVSAFDSPGSDALSNSLSVNNGTLNVQNSAALSVTTPTFTNNGSVSVLNGSTMNVGALTNVISTGAQGNVLTGGSYEIGGGSTLAYVGPTINTIGANTTLILDNTGGAPGSSTTGQLLASGFDAVSNSLTENNGTLTVQNNATLALITPTFTNNGSLNVLNDSTVTVGDLTNVISTSTKGNLLTGRSYDISGGSTFTYSGADINTIGAHTSVTLDGSASAILNSTVNGSGNALGSLQEVDGTLRLLNGASLNITAFNNVNSSGVFQYGNLELGYNQSSMASADSAPPGAGGTGGLTYNTGYDITSVAKGASITLDAGWVLNSSSGNPDALSNTLSSVAGSLAVVNGATLNLTQTLQNVSAGGYLGYGSFEVGNNATLSYVGSDINVIGGHASLTLDGNYTLQSSTGGTSPTLTDALSNSLTNVYGSLSVLNGAQLNLTQQLQNVSPDGTLIYGNIEVGNNQSAAQSAQEASLSYVGSDINNIGGHASLTLDGNYTLQASTGGTPPTYSDALSNSLGSVYGSLTLQNGANLTLTGANSDGEFYVGNHGNVNLNSGASLNLSNVYFENVQFLKSPPALAENPQLNFLGAGTLSGGNYFLGTNSTLIYGGPADIGTIGTGTSLTIDNSGRGNSGSIQNAYVTNNFGNNDALSNTLTLNNGNLALQNYASMTLSTGSDPCGCEAPEGFTNNGRLSLTNQSSLTVYGSYANSGATILNGGGNVLTAAGLTNDGFMLIKAGDTGNFVGGAFTNISSTGSLSGGAYHIGGTLQYDGTQSSVITDIAQGTSVTLDGKSGGAAQILAATADGTTNALSTLGSNEGNLALVNGASLTTTPGGGTFSNAGTVTLGTAGMTKQNVTQDAFSTSPGVVMTVDGSFMNSGTVTVNSGATLNVDGVYSSDAGAYSGTFTQTAGTTVIDGDLSINTADYTFFLQGGDLSGGGYLEANLDQTGGTLNPGDPQSLTVDGSYTLDPGGALDFDLAGFATNLYDNVNVTGSVSIDPNAELEISIDPNFLSQLQNVLQASGSYTFDNVLTFGQGPTPYLLSNPNYMGYSLSLVQDSTPGELDLTVSDSSSATPEPGTLSMLFGAMLLAGGIAWRERRRRKVSVN